MVNTQDPRWPLFTVDDGGGAPQRFMARRKTSASAPDYEIEEPEARQLIPEERLAEAVLVRAAMDAEMIIATSMNPDRLYDRPHQALNLRNDALALRRWVKSTSQDVQSAHWWCSAAGRDPKKFRAYMVGRYAEELVVAQKALTDWYYQQKALRNAPVTKRLGRPARIIRPLEF